MPINRVLDLTANVSAEDKAAQRAINVQRTDVRRFATADPHDRQVCIVGGAPSLADTVEEIRHRALAGAAIWATNNTFAWLTERGITPDAHVILDARPENAAFLRPTKGVTYYLHDTCHASLFEALRGCHVVMYGNNADLWGATTGTTVGLKSMYLAAFSGFRALHLFGMDSCFRETAHHAYPQPLNDGQKGYEVTTEGRTFVAAAWMINQAEEFQQIARSLAKQGIDITVAGDGLIPWIARRIGRSRRVLTAYYDLACCPPTYDFVSFLGEAELHRRAIGAECMDIVVQPGDADGFRNDDLPDDTSSRIGMLYRVVMGCARLVPSVRNIEMLKERRDIEGADIFPVEYRDNPVVQHYGATFFSRSFPVLRASDVARERVARLPRPYITITVRESTHWPQRNSNRPEWEKVARRLDALGYHIVWVPDAQSADCNEYSWDTDLRLALYEGAKLNLGVNNGPMCMLFYTGARYCIFKMVTDGIPWCEPEFLTFCGETEGVHHDGRGTLVWGSDDNAAAILSQALDCLARHDTKHLASTAPSWMTPTKKEQANAAD